MRCTTLPSFAICTVALMCMMDRERGNKKNKITEKVDVWELGILLYYLAFYSTPFESGDRKINTDALMAGKVSFPPNDSMEFSREFLGIIRKLLTPEVSK